MYFQITSKTKKSQLIWEIKYKQHKFPSTTGKGNNLCLKGVDHNYWQPYKERNKKMLSCQIFLSEGYML